MRRLSHNLQWQAISQADYVVPVEIEYHWHNVYVIKRPGVDAFLKKMGEIYEIVVFTASLSKVRSIFASASARDWALTVFFGSTRTPCSTSSTSTASSRTVCSVRAATTIAATTSRYV